MFFMLAIFLNERQRQKFVEIWLVFIAQNVKKMPWQHTKNTAQTYTKPYDHITTIIECFVLLDIASCLSI